ncbi:MAG: hypothetical protein PQJ50_12530 [Spirochaetales bacterium]|nr:hypothetical protein [Spirochaetales bacterium]
MQKKILFLLIAVSLLSVGCAKRTAEVAEPAAVEEVSSATPVSDGSEDLTVSFQLNLNEDDADNHFHWKGNMRYMEAEDSYDAVSGASLLGSTHLFSAYLYDVEGKNTLSSGLRGLFLFGVNAHATAEHDNVQAVKADDGTITIQYVHRGTAYRIITDAEGVIELPWSNIDSRKIGTPQEIEAAFSSNGEPSGVDYDKVWSEGTVRNRAADDAMYKFYGELQTTLEGDILAISGSMTAVKQ